jgi:hypothetical protein
MNQNVVFQTLNRSDWDELHKARSVLCCEPIVEVGKSSLPALKKLVVGENQVLKRRAMISLAGVWSSWYAKNWVSDALEAEVVIYEILYNLLQSGFKEDLRFFGSQVYPAVLTVHGFESQSIVNYQTLLNMKKFNPDLIEHRNAFYRFCSGR